MFVDIDYRTGLVGCAIVGGAISIYCYGSYAGDLEGVTILAITGGLSGIAFWLLYINDYLGFPKR